MPGSVWGAAVALVDALPYTALFHCVYWAARFVSSAFSSTYASLKESEKGYWAASVTSSVHAVIITIMAVDASNSSGMWTTEDFFLTTPATTYCMKVLVGYIMSDLILAVYYGSAWNGWVANWIHHIAATLTWGMVRFFFSIQQQHSDFSFSLFQLLDGEYGHCYAMIASICEATTPFINQRWFFDKCGMKASTMYLVNGLTILVGWFALRIVMFGWMFWRMYVMREQLLSVSTWPLLILSAVVGYALQIFWFRKIARGAWKVAFGKKKSN